MLGGLIARQTRPICSKRQIDRQGQEGEREVDILTTVLNFACTHTPPLLFIEISGMMGTPPFLTNPHQYTYSIFFAGTRRHRFKKHDCTNISLSSFVINGSKSWSVIKSCKRKHIPPLGATDSLKNYDITHLLPGKLLLLSGIQNNLCVKSK